MAVLGESLRAKAGRGRRFRRSLWGLLSGSVECFCRIVLDCAGLVGLVALLCGMVLVVQSTGELARYGAKVYVAKIVTVTLLRELGPVLTGILAAGLVGASVVAHTGTLAAGHGLDAMRNLGIGVERTLVWPRLLAAPPALFTLCALFDLLGIAGAALAAAWMRVVSPGGFLALAAREATFYDVSFGMLKAACFGLAVALVSTETALRVRPGAGSGTVAGATTRAIFWSCACVMILDFLLSHLYFVLGPLAHVR